ncbi:MAG: DUF2804 domain-containing protein [Eubacteriales bacterium]|nr:DUF2804 domain-containing protein [Eubacteriales bacterium]
MQHEITQKGRLLNEKGDIREPGWARRLLLTYDRNDIKIGRSHIKEWDYYLVTDGRYGVALTLADNGYMGMLSASLLDFEHGWEHTQSAIKPFPMGKYRLPATSETGDAAFSGKGLQMAFTKTDGARRIQCTYENFYQGKTLEVDITLTEPYMDTMVIATPFGKPKHFYYNQKINCMPAVGFARWGDVNVAFAPDTAFGVLDWGRGVWTYENTWYWGSASGLHEGKPFGFNIGYGFGDTSAASENILFYNGKGHKLDRLTFHIPADSYLKPWTFSSSDGRFEMDFTPVLDRNALTNALVLLTDQHQVFGRFTGRAVLDDGTVLAIKDFFGFAEKVRMKY